MTQLQAISEGTIQNTQVSNLNPKIQTYLTISSTPSPTNSNRFPFPLEISEDISASSHVDPDVRLNALTAGKKAATALHKRDENFVLPTQEKLYPPTKKCHGKCPKRTAMGQLTFFSKHHGLDHVLPMELHPKVNCRIKC